LGIPPKSPRMPERKADTKKLALAAALSVIRKESATHGK